MTTDLPQNEAAHEDDVPTAALDEDAAPDTGLEPDTAPDAAGEQPGPGGDESVDAGTAAERTELTGPALENDEMRRGTDALRSSEDNSAEARQIADDLARRTEPVGADEPAS